MTIPCKHATDCGITGASCCDLGLYGGRPSFGVCLLACKKYDGPDRMPLITQLKNRLAQETTMTPSVPSFVPCRCKAPIRTWLGMRWFGVPWPVRYYRCTVLPDHPMPWNWPGCGCIYKLKILWEGLKWVAKATRKA